MGASRRLANAAAAGEEGEGTEATAATTVPVDLGTATAAAPPMGQPGWRRRRPPRGPARGGQRVASARRVTRKRAPGRLAGRRAATCPAVGLLVACRRAAGRHTGRHHVRCRAAILHALCRLAACCLTAIDSCVAAGGQAAAGRLATVVAASKARCSNSGRRVAAGRRAAVSRVFAASPRAAAGRRASCCRAVVLLAAGRLAILHSRSISRLAISRPLAGRSVVGCRDGRRVAVGYGDGVLAATGGGC